MSLENCSRSSSVQSQLLPKSVKVRSTCNACQQAKIRCSHEKPSCRRCQKHNIECIYSMSRRLGRPAKKKDSSLQEEQLDKSAENRRSPKKVKTPKKDQDAEDASSRLEGSMDEISIEDSLQTPLLADIVDKGVFPDSMDFSPDTWFQDLVSGQSTDPIQDYSFFDPFESSFPSLSTGFKDPNVFLSLPPSTDTCDIPPPPPTYFPLDYTTTLHPTATATATTHDIPTDYITTPSTAAPKPIFPSLPPSSYTKTTLLDPVDTILPAATTTASTDQDLNPPFQLPDPPFPEDDLTLTLPFDTNTNTNTTPLDPPSQSQSQPASAPAPQCQCYETALRELLRANICASRPTSSSPPLTQTQSSPSTIDAILTCQRSLQQLAETVLQCGLCSRTRINLLMVIIVSIDSLLSTLEASTTASTNPMAATVTTGGGGGKTTLFDTLSDEDLPLPGFDSIPISRRYKDHTTSSTTATTTTATATTSGNPNPGTTFKSQIESCPLLVGGFPIPLDEKCSFIKQLLHTRLSGLLATIRRIRFCTQQVLASSASRGRLIMMMETDRRLQVIIMRVKMLSR